MRTDSDKPAANGGFWHPLDGERIKTLPPKEKHERETVINAHALFKHWEDRTSAIQVNELAGTLGVKAFALHSIGIAWMADKNAWAFPMRNGQGAIVGIRLRSPNGDKYAVKGSHAGLFVSDETPVDTIWICEGPTDAAALISIGLYAIGRPSCLGCETEVNDTIKRFKIRRAVIVGDNDGPGERGALKLQDTMSIPSVIWFPPAKDAREFVRCGGTAQMAMSMTKDLLWSRKL